MVIGWSEDVGGFTAADITTSHSTRLKVLNSLNYNNEYSLFFILVDPNDADDFYITIREDAVTEGNPKYTFPPQGDPPGAPTGLMATVSKRSISLSWTAPTDDGGLAITDYEVRYVEGNTAGGEWVSIGGTQTTHTLTGLDGKTQYTFQVRAVNTAGDSDPSAVATATTDTVVPLAPTSLTADPDPTQVALSWTAPADNGGSAITRYEYRYKEGSGNYSAWTTTGGTSTSFTVKGLAKGTQYTFEVRAVNTIGDSDASNTVTTTTDKTKPGAPTGLTVTASGRGFSVSWTAPTDTGGTVITRYEYRYQEGTAAGGTWRSAGTNTSRTLSGLKANTQYTFQVRAVNSEGDSDASAAVTERTEKTAPDAPTSLTVSTKSTTAVLSWTAGADTGGSAITRYEYRYKEGSRNYSAWTTTGGTSTSFTVKGLARSTQYSFQVRAVNTIGNSPESNTVTETTQQTDVGAPTGFEVTVTATTAVLSWTAPTQTEGETITDYEVRYAKGDEITGAWASAGTNTSETITGLEKGTEYSFQVRARIAAGAGIASTVVTETTLATKPGAPTGLRATPAQTTVALSWTAPTDTGGTPITGYEYRIGTGNWISTGATGTSFTVTKLTGNKAYTFQIRAVNAKAESSPSNTASVKTTAIVPSAPASLTVTTTATTATLTWTAPASNGGSAITRYESRVGTGKWTDVGTDLSVTLTGLEKGTAYTFEVRAVNAIGDGKTRQQTATTETTVPGAPTGLTVSRTHNSATLSWKAPADNGGTPITDYEVRHAEGGTISGAWVSAGTNLSETFSNLKTRTRYTFQARAVNAKGESSPSETVSATTTAVPGSPIITNPYDNDNPISAYVGEPFSAKIKITNKPTRLNVTGNWVKWGHRWLDSENSVELLVTPPRLLKELLITDEETGKLLETSGIRMETINPKGSDLAMIPFEFIHRAPIIDDIPDQVFYPGQKGVDYTIRIQHHPNVISIIGDLLGLDHEFAGEHARIFGDIIDGDLTKRSGTYTVDAANATGAAPQKTGKWRLVPKPP